MSQEKHLGTYQMLWDCEFCGTQKLLGLTHRFCPNCGAAQNPEKRYFPSDEEKIAVEDHQFVGADVICPACDTPNSAASQFCMQCGTSLAGAQSATTQASETRDKDGQFKAGQVRDTVKEAYDAQVASLTAGNAPSGGFLSDKRVWIGAAVVFALVCIGLIYAVFFWNRTATASVSGHEWVREIEIQSYEARSRNAWCDSLPSGAYDVTRRREVREQERVQVGETCRVVRVDNGDGTFSEREQCDPQYESRDVYDEKCYFTLNVWDTVRTESESGASLTDNPIWPEVSLTRTGDCLGCEREGEREESYIVYFEEGDSRYECRFDDMERWRDFPLESRWQLRINRLTGDPDCDSIEAAP